MLRVTEIAFSCYAAIAQLRVNNVKFRIEPMATPVCHMTMIYEPDGNTICIHKRKVGHH